MNELTNKLNIMQTKLSVPKSNFNKFGKYKYRSCEDILEAVKPLLKETKTTLTFSDSVIEIGGRFYIETIVSLSDGKDYIKTKSLARESDIKKGMASAQITGAASSYARKYALNGLFCIDDTKDADSTNKHDNEDKQENINMPKEKIAQEHTRHEDKKEEMPEKFKLIFKEQYDDLVGLAKFCGYSDADLLEQMKSLGHNNPKTITVHDLKTMEDYFKVRKQERENWDAS